MNKLGQILIDAREQVRGALASMEVSRPFALRGRYPKGRDEGEVVTWCEYSNVATDCPVVDELVFQVELWTFDPDSQNELAGEVNRVLTGLGLRRVYAGPDSYEDVGPGYYHKTFRFGRKVDKRTMRLID